MKSELNFEFKCCLARFFAVTFERRLILHRYYSPASHALRVISLWHTTAQPRSCVQARILRSCEVWLKVCTSHLRLARTCHGTASFALPPPWHLEACALAMDFDMVAHFVAHGL